MTASLSIQEMMDHLVNTVSYEAVMQREIRRCILPVVSAKFSELSAKIPPA